jgi:outer membrane protein OmpA-like peptidoglycan-associated protein/Tol biopolymer transport system component
MKIIGITWFCLLFLLQQGGLHAQVSSSSKKAVKVYNTGIEHYSRRQYKEAVADLNEAVKIDGTFIEAYMLLGECYLETGEPARAKAAFLQTARINPDFFPPVYYSIAEISFEMGEYEEANHYLKQFFAYSNQKPALVSKGKKLQNNSLFAAGAVKNPVPFQPENIGLQFEYDQYWPSLSVDEQTLVFTALIPKDTGNAAIAGNRQEDFFITTFEDDKWSVPGNLGSPPNTPDNEGAQTITADASMMFFTACNRKDGKGACDIYFSEKRDGLWTRPRNLGSPVNTSAKETQPSISADGRTLYFVSNRNGGKGGQDIWVSALSDDGTWGDPVNLADINTADDESSPFIHPDNRTLYFASNGHPGMGKYDLFLSRKDSSGKWSNPENLGYPINTVHNEEGMVVNAKGNRAYYSSDRTEKNIRNIFSFELYPAARPAPVSYMKGKIYDARYYKPLKARFELIELPSADRILESLSDSTTGEFLVCIPSGKNYALNIRREGYLFYSEHFTMSGGSYQEPMLKDIPLRRIKSGEKIILKNIFFTFDSHKLLDESRAELQQLVRFLRENPDVKVRITGHTDNTGNAAYNLQLSQNRARAVANYLLGEGVPMNRVSYKGKGASEPVAGNDTEEGRAQNRRTEMEIQ